MDSLGVGLLDQLDSSDSDAILGTRRRLAQIARAVPGPDVGGTSTLGTYRPAYYRYRGAVYRPVPHQHWPRPGDRCVVVVVSALYGLVLAWETIQNYELTMATSLSYRRPVRALWRAAHLDDVLARWASHTGVECVIDLLSLGYRAALDDLAALDRIRIRRIVVDYPRRFNAANHDRGRDLAELLAFTSAAGC